MFAKMSFALGLWFVCGFFTNLPTVYSLQCYACADYPGSEDPCNDGAPVIQCESYFDSCSTQTTTLEIFGQDYTTIAKNCSIAQFSCDPAYTCDLVNSSVASSGGTMKQCHLNCCYSDLCNGQGGGSPTSPTPGPNPLSQLKYYIETFRALLDQMEYTVDHDLGGHVSRSAREYKGRSKRALNDIYAALKNEEQQKRNSIIDGLKRNADELTKKLETKRGRSKKRVAFSRGQKKREAKSDLLMREAMKTIQESLARLVPQKR